MDKPDVITREIRWFFKEHRPGLMALFQSLQPGQYTMESRGDDYLLLPERADLGIKIRMGRLEMKFRTRGPESFVISSIHGKMECWEKFGFELKQDMTLPVLPKDSETSWIRVDKQRWVTTMHVIDGTVHFDPPGLAYPESVQVEYTRISLKGHEWYTFGFEWPKEQALMLPDSFLRQWVVPEGLSEANSMGYPAFLIQFISAL